MTTEDRGETVRRIQTVFTASRQLGGFPANEVKGVFRYLKDKYGKLCEGTPRRGKRHSLYSRWCSKQ
jgi:hypothetical protein